MISPWDRGSVAALRPSPRKAILLVDSRVPLSTAMRETVPTPRSHLGRVDPGAGDGDPVGLRQRRPRPAGGIARRRRAGRAVGRAAAVDHPPARLPLARRRGDPPRLRRADGRRRPGRPLTAFRGDDDRRALARRLHDDGARARGRLFAAGRLALPRGACRRPTARRGGADHPRRRRPHHVLRRVGADRRAWSSPPPCSPGRCCSRWRSRPRW